MEITELLPNKKSSITVGTEKRQRKSSYEVDIIEIKTQNATEDALRRISLLSNAEQKSEHYSLEEDPEKIISQISQRNLEVTSNEEKQN